VFVIIHFTHHSIIRVDVPVISFSVEHLMQSLGFATAVVLSVENKRIKERGQLENLQSKDKWHKKKSLIFYIISGVKQKTTLWK